jgi:hypothetical protein
LEREGVEADAFSGRRRSCKFIIEGEDAIGGGEGEIGILVDSGSTGHFWSVKGVGVVKQVSASERPMKEQCRRTVLKICVSIVTVQGHRVLLHR